MGKDCIQEISHEIRMLELSLSHPRIVDIIEVFDAGHDIVVITEYARGGELFQHVMMEEQIEENVSVRLMRQVLEGVQFLHQNNIVHMDIKPQNILLTEPLPAGNIKLCDLGLARYFNCGDDVQEIIGTPDYVAPEVLDYNKLNSACDMWSIGVLTYVMLSGCSPFAGDTKQETFLNISQVNLDFPEDLFSTTSDDAIDFMRKLLLREPEDRMTAETALTHGWLLISKPGSRRSSVSSLTFGSPAGQRRTVTSTSFGDCSCDEPSKRCKCDTSPKSALTVLGYSSDKENRLAKCTQFTTDEAATLSNDRATGTDTTSEREVQKQAVDLTRKTSKSPQKTQDLDGHLNSGETTQRQRDCDTCSILKSSCRLSDVSDMSCSSLLCIGQATAE